VGTSAAGIESAWADLLASEEARRTVVTTLVSDVATAYFPLRELDLELEIARRTLESRRTALQLVQARQKAGVASLLEVRQAETLLYTAAAIIPTPERRIAQTENLISVLIGRTPPPSHAAVHCCSSWPCQWCRLVCRRVCSSADLISAQQSNSSSLPMHRSASPGRCSSHRWR